MKRHNGEENWITFVFENPEADKSLVTKLYLKQNEDFESIDGSKFSQLESVTLEPAETKHMCLVRRPDSRFPSTDFKHKLVDCDVF